MTKRRSYPTDLTDAEWEIVEPLIPKPKRRGPKANVDVREVLNGIFYFLHEGCQWRALPQDLPPWTTVSNYFRKWQRKGIWSRIQQKLQSRLREEQGRNPEPSPGIIDSQEREDWRKKGEVYGYDGGKQIKGRKRHILVDSQGLLLAVVVSEARGTERVGGMALLLEVESQLPNLSLIWVDAGYQGPNFSRAVEKLTQAQVEVVKRSSKAFEVLPRRWVVERTFAWLVQNRRLVIDSEKLPEISEALIKVAMTRLMLKRLAMFSA
ncbi:IS5 family transposase [Euhalothece natronophila]|uniref:IS5 family transposase n=1 Tax=Euhalothece natronophila TaxID=577489 RepID=UPI0036F394FA